MNELMAEHASAVLAIIAIANTVALFAAGVMINSFRRTIDKLQDTDRILEMRVGTMEVNVARLEEANATRHEDIKAILSKLESIEAKFAEYERNIREFYRDFDLPRKQTPL